MLPVLCCIDLFGLRAFRGVYDWPNMPILLTGLAIGIVVGTLIFGIVRQDVLRLIIGAIRPLTDSAMSGTALPTADRFRFIASDQTVRPCIALFVLRGVHVTGFSS